MEKNCRNYCSSSGKSLVLLCNISYIFYFYSHIYIKFLLKIFSKATKYVSTAKVPVLAISVPTYDWIMDKLEEFQTSDKISPDLKNAVDLGMKKIISYYKRTDECSLYAIATSKLLLLIHY